MDEPTYGPAGQDYTLASGRKVRFEQPDLFALAQGKADIPNAVVADIFNLLYRDRKAIDPAQQLVADQAHTQRLYYIGQMVLVPRLKLDDDDETGVIGRKEVSLGDLGSAFNFLLYGPPPPSPPAKPESNPLAPAQSTPGE